MNVSHVGWTFETVKLVVKICVCTAAMAGSGALFSKKTLHNLEKHNSAKTCGILLK